MEHQFNNDNPFTVPDGYFDTLQERIMARVQASGGRPAAVQGRTINMKFYRRLVAAAACLLLIFAGAALYVASTGSEPTVAESAMDDDAFYQWFYASDKATMLAESLDINPSDNDFPGEENISAEDEEIIRFLERDNINVVAIVHSLDHSPVNP